MLCRAGELWSKQEGVIRVIWVIRVIRGGVGVTWGVRPAAYLHMTAINKQVMANRHSHEHTPLTPRHHDPNHPNHPNHPTTSPLGSLRLMIRFSLCIYSVPPEHIRKHEALADGYLLEFPGRQSVVFVLVRALEKLAKAQQAVLTWRGQTQVYADVLKAGVDDVDDDVDEDVLMMLMKMLMRMC